MSIVPALKKALKIITIAKDALSLLCALWQKWGEQRRLQRERTKKKEK